MLSDKNCRETWIIGYGNDQRQDDGIGPYVIERLKTLLGARNGIHLAAYHQLQADLTEELAQAELIVMIDAAADPRSLEIQWARVKPDCNSISHVTHHCRPSFLMGLLEWLYDVGPPAWLVSVRGEDFGFSPALTPEGQKRAERAAHEIASFVTSQNN